LEPLDIGFVIEQTLGHVTHTKNLQAIVPGDPSVRAHWGLIPWSTNRLESRVPLYRSNWTVRAGLRARAALTEMARGTRLRALYFHTQVPAVLATSWVQRIPSVISLDATPMQYDELGEFYAHETGPAWLERLKWRLNRDCFRAARHLVTFAAWTKAGLVRDYEVPADKVTVIPPGVSTREWTRPEPRTQRDGPVRILFVGGDLKRKGGLDLLEAFRSLRSSLDVQLWLVTADKVTPEPGVVVHGGLQPNSAPLKQLYFDADVFCLPTHGDCIPNVLSEAGAAGLPSVSTRLAGIPEVVRDGETGFVVSRGDVAALTDALRRLVENPELRLEMGARARRHVVENYDAERNTARLLNLLKGIANDPRPG
jgi:glycosyltransferase involved in cell wall biosynthesis